FTLRRWPALPAHRRLAGQTGRRHAQAALAGHDSPTQPLSAWEGGVGAMTPEERPFSPQDIDDQIDRLAQALHPSQASEPTPSRQQIVNALDTLYTAEAEELSQALARGRARLAQSMRLQHERQRRTGDHPRLLQERQ